MQKIETQFLSADEQGISQAVKIWKSRGLVAFPTETVYGLGADACNGTAVARIFEAKGRPHFNPLIIHVFDLVVAEEFAVFSETAHQLAKAFWPGPLSLVLPVRPGSGLSELVTAGLDTVAIRVPENPVARKLLHAFGGAIAAPSANASGTISPTEASHVRRTLEGRIDAILDGGSCNVGMESTIVMPDHNPPALLRPGGLPAEALELALGCALTRAEDPEAPLSPGQLASHYAPSVQVRLDAKAVHPNELLLAFGPGNPDADLNLSPSGDLREAAANLFKFLHELDARARATGKTGIAVTSIPGHGLGLAINDRLKRASAPR